MIRIHLLSCINHWVGSVNDRASKYPIYQLAGWVLAEAIKIFAVKMFLEFFGRCFLKSKVTNEKIFLLTIVAPLAEELFFRGFLLQGVIHLGQKTWNHLILRRELTAEEERAQQNFRVYVSTFLFAVAHLTNPHESRTSALIQFSWTYVGGLTCGYLSEKYRTLSVSILAHGLNNCLVGVTIVHTQLNNNIAMILRAAVFINELSFYHLATYQAYQNSSDEQNIAECCVATSRFIRSLMIANMLYSKNVSATFIANIFLECVSELKR